MNPLSPCSPSSHNLRQGLGRDSLMPPQLRPGGLKRFSTPLNALTWKWMQRRMMGVAEGEREREAPRTASPQGRTHPAISGCFRTPIPRLQPWLPRWNPRTTQPCLHTGLQSPKKGSTAWTVCTTYRAPVRKRNHVLAALRFPLIMPRTLVVEEARDTHPFSMALHHQWLLRA